MEMDLVALSLKSKMAKAIVGRLIAKQIEKQLEQDIKVKVDAVEVATVGDELNLSLNITMGMKTNDLLSMIKDLV